MPKILLNNGIRLHYLRLGEGPDLVMLHGLGGNLAVWHLQMVPILRDHFRVLTPDMRGHGYSDMPPTGYSSADMAGDLELMLDALGIDSCFLLGHSYGADAALYFALTHPDRVKQVIAVEAGIPALINLRRREDWEGWTYWVRLLAQYGVTVPPEKASDVDYLLRMSLQVPRIFGPGVGSSRKSEPLLKLLETTLVKDYEIIGDLTLENIARIQTPVHLIFGEGSAYLGTYTYLLEHLPDVTGILLPPTKMGGHFGVLEQPELLTENILRYFAPAPKAIPR